MFVTHVAFLARGGPSPRGSTKRGEL